jgi:hypothetical protein
MEIVVAEPSARIELAFPLYEGSVLPARRTGRWMKCESNTQGSEEQSVYSRLPLPTGLSIRILDVTTGGRGIEPLTQSFGDFAVPSTPPMKQRTKIVIGVFRSRVTDYSGPFLISFQVLSGKTKRPSPFRNPASEECPLEGLTLRTGFPRIQGAREVLLARTDLILRGWGGNRVHPCEGKRGPPLLRAATLRHQRCGGQGFHRLAPGPTCLQPIGCEFIQGTRQGRRCQGRPDNYFSSISSGALPDVRAVGSPTGQLTPMVGLYFAGSCSNTSAVCFIS